MKCYYIGIVLSMMLIFASCTENQKKKEVVSWNEYDSVCVSIDYPILPSYSRLVPYVHLGNTFAVGYNHLIHALDFINLSGGSHHEISLQREGADAVLPPVSFCLALDFIVWEDASGVSLLTMEGKVIERLSLSEVGMLSDKYLMKPMGVTDGSVVSIYPVGEQVVIPMTSAVLDENTYIGKVYDLVKRKLDILPFKYPSRIIEEAGTLGSLAFPHITGNGDRLIYNFPCSSMIYEVDVKTGESVEIDLNSCTIANEPERTENLPPRQKFERESTCGRFGEAYYSPSLGKYYRIHYGSKERMFDKDRSIYLMFYDERTHDVIEYLLPGIFSEQYIVADDMIYFMCKSSDDLSIHCAKIDLKKCRF